MSPEKTGNSTDFLVACLCAEWCGTCRDYRAVFEQLQAQFQGIRFLWIDVEDESELVDPIEVEDFPTLLLATRERVCFFGTVTPHRQTLERLVRSALEPDAIALPAEPQRDALVQRLWHRHS